MKLRTGHMNRALSTVLTTIIILVASVVLATGVVLYGTSLFQTSTQQEAISVTGMQLWVHNIDANGLSWGAYAVRNTGDKILSVDKISIRGVDIPFTQWYPDTTVSTNTLQQSMNFTGWSGVDGGLDITGPDSCASEPTQPFDVEARLTADSGGESGSVCADSATGPVGLAPGEGAIIYFQLTNGTVTTLDAGVTSAVGVFAGKTGAPIIITIASKA